MYSACLFIHRFRGEDASCGPSSRALPRQRRVPSAFPRYGEVAPKTAENFRGLCTGEYGPRSNGKPLTYKGTRFTRIIPGFVIQGVEFKVRRSRLGRCWVEHLRQEVRRRDVRRVAEPSRHFGDGKYGKEHEPVSVLHHNSACEGEC